MSALFAKPRRLPPLVAGLLTCLALGCAQQEDSQAMPQDRPGVLILCSGNSCRSQMAEGWWRELAGDGWRVYSAGAKPSGKVHPLAVQVMQEAGVDIAAHRSKSIDEALAEAAGACRPGQATVDLIITVCDPARDACPVVPGVKETLHWPFDDPPAATGADAERLAVFRRVRDEIAAKIRSYLAQRTQS